MGLWATGWQKVGHDWKDSMNARGGPVVQYSKKNRRVAFLLPVCFLKIMINLFIFVP